MKSAHTAVADFENQLRFGEKEYIPLDEQEIDQSYLLSGSKEAKKLEVMSSVIFH